MAIESLTKEELQRIQEIITSIQSSKLDLIAPAQIWDWSKELLAYSYRVGITVSESEQNYYAQFVHFLGIEKTVSKAEVHAKATLEYKRRRQYQFLYETIMEGIKLLKRFLSQMEKEENANQMDK